MTLSLVTDYGSEVNSSVVTLAATTYTDSVTVVAAGTECRLDHINCGSADDIELAISAQTVGGVTKGSWYYDPQGPGQTRTGISCGPFGIESDDGLVIVLEDITAAGGDVRLSVAYGNAAGVDGPGFSPGGFGSWTEQGDVTLAAAASETVAVVAAGTRCVYDGISIDGGSAAACVSSDLSIQDASGTVLHTYLDVRMSGQAHTRYGVRAGPYGYRSSNGLQVVATNNDGSEKNLIFEVHYRLQGA